MQTPAAPFKWTRQRERAALLVAEDKLSDREIAAEIKAHVVTLERWKQHPDFQARVSEHVAAYRQAIRQKGIAVVENRVDALNQRWEAMQRIIAARAADPSMAEIPGGSTGLLIRRGKLVKVYEPVKVSLEGHAEGDPCPRCAGEEGLPRLRAATITKIGSEDAREGLICPICMERWRETDTLASAKLNEIVYEYELDTGLLKELREHEKQAAQELGQWTERKDITSGDKPLVPLALITLGDLDEGELDRRLADAEAHFTPGGVSSEPGAIRSPGTGSSVVE